MLNKCFPRHNNANLQIICRLVKFPSEPRTELKLDMRYLPTRECLFVGWSNFLRNRAPS